MSDQALRTNSSSATFSAAPTYVEEEVAKIMQEYPPSLNVAMACMWMLGHLKGEELKLLHTAQTSSLADYYALATANNATQAQAMADLMIKTLRPYNISCLSREGQAGAAWILLDFQQVLVHIFSPQARQVYALDELWQKAESIKIPASYYGPSDELPPPPPRNYF